LAAPLSSCPLVKVQVIGTRPKRPSIRAVLPAAATKIVLRSSSPPGPCEGPKLPHAAASRGVPMSSMSTSTHPRAPSLRDTAAAGLGKTTAECSDHVWLPRRLRFSGAAVDQISDQQHPDPAAPSAGQGLRAPAGHLRTQHVEAAGEPFVVPTLWMRRESFTLPRLGLVRTTKRERAGAQRWLVRPAARERERRTRVGGSGMCWD